jgi:hypothetical protein
MAYRARIGARIARTLLPLMLVALVSGCGHKHRASAAAPTPVGYGVQQVKRAFAAAGVPLAALSQYGGITVFSGFNLDDEYDVQVLPPQQANGPRWVAFRAGHRMIAVRNVVADYAPGSKAAPRVQLAMAALRRH